MIRFIIATFFLYSIFLHNYAQIELSFTAKLDNKYHQLDSILIINTSNSHQLKKYYPDTILTLNYNTKCEKYLYRSDIIKNFPNPFTDKTFIFFRQTEKQEAIISINNSLGQTVSLYKSILDPGIHSFTFIPSHNDVYFLKAVAGKKSKTIKLVHLGRGSSYNNFKYNGIVSYEKRDSEDNEFEFVYGDNLMIIGYITTNQNQVMRDTIFDYPASNNLYMFDFNTNNKILILNYHAIRNTETVTHPLHRHVNDLEQDILFFKNNNFQFFSIYDISLVQTGIIQMTSHAVVFTFDDGYLSNYTLAYPLLKQYNVPATFFIVTDWVGKSGKMNWSQILTMISYINDEGKSLFTVGSHTHTHPNLEQAASNYSNVNDYISFLHFELSNSKNIILSHTDQSEIILALPYGAGANNQYIIETLQNLGYIGMRRSLGKSFTKEEINMFKLPGFSITSDFQVEMLWQFFQ